VKNNGLFLLLSFKFILKDSNTKKEVFPNYRLYLDLLLITFSTCVFNANKKLAGGTNAKVTTNNFHGFMPGYNLFFGSMFPTDFNLYIDSISGSDSTNKNGYLNGSFHSKSTNANNQCHSFNTTRCYNIGVPGQLVGQTGNTQLWRYYNPPADFAEYYAGYEHLDGCRQLLVRKPL